MKVYQALLSRQENIASVQQMRHEIVRIGGKVEIAPPTTAGMVVVTLWLPPDHQPQEFFPGLPFYPI